MLIEKLVTLSAINLHFFLKFLSQFSSRFLPKPWRKNMHEGEESKMFLIYRGSEGGEFRSWRKKIKN